MKRSILRVLIFLFCFVFVSAGKADTQTTPDRYTFMLSQQRLKESFERGNPIFWSVQTTPDAVDGFDLGAMDLLQSIVSKMELSGAIQSNRDGTGWMDFAVLMNNERISSFSQMTRDGRVGMQMNSNWFSTSEEEEDLARSMLSFDALGESLLSFPYEQIRTMKMPFVAPLNQAGFKLWELASPWSDDNDRLSASSGATSHGLTYTIDTAAARSILSQWADSLTIDQFQYGLEGTDLFIGLNEEPFNRFIERLRELAQLIEMSNPLVINMAFGEGDALSYARGSGTVSVGGKRTNVSLRYTRDTSKTKIKHRLTIDFQPKQGDTLELDLTLSQGSNNKTNASTEVKLSASGQFDGLPYQIRYNSYLENNYQLDDNKHLSEVISGTTEATVKYNDQMVANVAVSHESSGFSTLGEKAIEIHHAYHTTLKNADGLLFSGPITVSLEMKEGPDDPPSMDSTLYIEALDFIQLETLRESIANAQAVLKQNVLDVLSPVTSIVQRGSQ